jgi:hypothetical protein
MLGTALITALALLAARAPQQAHAHSWVEQLTVIGPDGTYVGAPGYPRGNVLRSNPAFGDPAMVNLIPGNGRTSIAPDERMCKSSQATPNQTPGSPALRAAPGSLVALRFQENGHVTLPQTQRGKPDNRGTVYVYGTADARATDTFLQIHRVWNAQGTGGDKRGRLLAAQNFDDGQCYQVNSGGISVKRQSAFPHAPSPLMGADLWCQNNIKLPAEARAGQRYTLYWVWDWPTAPGADAALPKGKLEIYTTCMDIEVTNDVRSNDSSSDSAEGAGTGTGGIKNKNVAHNPQQGSSQQKKDYGNSAIPSLLAQVQGGQQPQPQASSNSVAPAPASTPPATSAAAPSAKTSPTSAPAPPSSATPPPSMSSSLPPPLPSSASPLPSKLAMVTMTRVKTMTEVIVAPASPTAAASTTSPTTLTPSTSALLVPAAAAAASAPPRAKNPRDLRVRAYLAGMGRHL